MAARLTTRRLSLSLPEKLAQLHWPLLVVLALIVPAIFVVEDDAQNGPDHVDAHRTVALVISPYTKRNHVDSTMYSTSSMLRTMELILGLQPMSQFDAAARPMYHSFQAKADPRPYEHAPAQVDLDAKNPKDAWGAEESVRLDLSREDAADDLHYIRELLKGVPEPRVYGSVPRRLE